MTYAPRGGSAAQGLIEHLQAAEAGTRMDIDAIADQFGVLRANVTTVLRQSVNEGLLEITKEGRTRYYHLPEEGAEEERSVGELAINSDSTGDLWFTGAHVGDDGAVLLSQAQLQQLVSYATTPPVRLSVASEVAN